MLDRHRARPRCAYAPADFATPDYPVTRPDAALLPASGQLVAEVEGVNARTWWKHPLGSIPQTPEQAQRVETLFVDVNGHPIIVRRPRPVGFRPR